MKALITGIAGFIGFHLARRLISSGVEVIGVDNISSYYDVNLKYARLEKLGLNRRTIEEKKTDSSEKLIFYKCDISNRDELKRAFSHSPDIVCNLAAQAGVRHSLTHPEPYIQTNIVGFFNILEESKASGVKHIVFASSSSVYGLNGKLPFSVHDNVDHPISLYAATKKSNELIAHTYSYLYNIPVTGLRFFTVYGPWGRPDMALFKFTKNIIEGKPIEVYNYGEMERDFTYIDDIVEAVVKIMKSPPHPNGNWNASKPDPASSVAPYRVYNIGNNRPVKLMDYIEAIEKNIGRKAKKLLLPMQPGDVKATWADVDDLIRDFYYKPSTPVDIGVSKFVEWYLDYFKPRV